MDDEEKNLKLMAVVMPVMDGFEACKKIKEDRALRHIPVVMVTALSDRESRLKSLEAGANGPDQGGLSRHDRPAHAGCGVQGRACRRSHPPGRRILRPPGPGSGLERGASRDHPLPRRCTTSARSASRRRSCSNPARSHEETVRIITVGDGRTLPGHFAPAVLEAFKDTHGGLSELYERMRD